MLENNQKKTPPTTPVLIKDLGMMFATETSKRKEHFGLYKCNCSKEFITRTSSVKNGSSTSCGCVKIAISKECNTTHGLCKHPLYITLKNIIQRTTNTNNNHFSSYGGRGITICDEWKNDFMSFYNWALSHGWKKGLSIDRIDVNGNYEPSNCRFTTREVQQRNTRVLMVTNSSGYRGVYWHKRAKKWVARISISGKRIYLGLFNTALEGGKAYDNYVIANNLEHTKNFQYDLI